MPASLLNGRTVHDLVTSFVTDTSARKILSGALDEAVENIKARTGGAVDVSWTWHNGRPVIVVKKKDDASKFTSFPL